LPSHGTGIGNRTDPAPHHEPTTAPFLSTSVNTRLANNAVTVRGYDMDGSYSLVWCREGGANKIAFWSWHVAGSGATRLSFNEIFRNGSGFSKEPNQLLIDTVAKVKPGAALDVGMGQGRNSLYTTATLTKMTASPPASWRPCSRTASTSCATR
jgi:hypothetical protein